MISTFNGCYFTEIKVHPKNWKNSASLKDDWYFYYRFYDPTVKDNCGNIKPKLVIGKGMNKYKTLGERREATKILVADELELLQKEGFNPITKAYMIDPILENDSEIDPSTPFIDALKACLKLIDKSPHTKEDIASNLRYIEPAAEQLRIHRLPIKDIRRKHIKALLNRLAIIKPTMDIIVKNKKGQKKVVGKGQWTNNTFNQYRKNLSILFEELLEMEATEVNPVHGIKKKKHAIKKREVLTPEQCEIVDQFARSYDSRFWLLINIFHLSGARTTEIVKVQGKHVDLRKQSVQYLVMKGDQFEWVDRPIVDEALPFWEMAMRDCGKEDFVFSVGLQPGSRSIRPEQISRRWKRHIKDKLGIDCDWYALKHLNTTRNVDKVVEMIREAQLQAGKLNAHKSEKMVAKVYDINSFKRLFEELKEKSVGFTSTH